MKIRLLVAAVVSFALTIAPAFLRALLASPRSGGTTVDSLAWKGFVALTYPPVYLSDRLGWHDALRSDVLKGVSVFEPTSLGTMLWTHSVVAFPFWFLVVFMVALALHWIAAMLGRARARAGARS